LNKMKIRLIGVFGDVDTVSGGGSGHVNPGPRRIVTPLDGIKAAMTGSGASAEYFPLPKENGLIAAAEFAKTCDVIVVVVATTSIEGYDRPSLALGNGQDELVFALNAANSHIIVVVNTPGAVLMPFAVDVSTLLVAWMPGEEAGNALADVLFGHINPSARLPVTMPNMDNEVRFTKDQFPGIGHPRVANYSEELLIGYRWYDAHNISPLFPFGYGLSYTTFKYSNLILRGVLEANPDHGISAAKPSVRGEVDLTTLTVDKNNLLSISRFDKLFTVTATIQNTGDLPGTETAQLYVTYPENMNEPPRQLKGIQKIGLLNNESGDVVFNISSQDIAMWDSDIHNWKLGCNCDEKKKERKYSYFFNTVNSIFNGFFDRPQPVAKSDSDASCCTFYVLVGASSRDLYLIGKVVIQ